MLEQSPRQPPQCLPLTLADLRRVTAAALHCSPVSSPILQNRTKYKLVLWPSILAPFARAPPARSPTSPASAVTPCSSTAPANDPLPSSSSFVLNSITAPCHIPTTSNCSQLTSCATQAHQNPTLSCRPCPFSLAFSSSSSWFELQWPTMALGHFLTKLHQIKSYIHPRDATSSTPPSMADAVAGNSNVDGELNQGELDLPPRPPPAPVRPTTVLPLPPWCLRAPPSSTPTSPDAAIDVNPRRLPEPPAVGGRGSRPGLTPCQHRLPQPSP